jgi:protein TonB
MSAGKFKPFGFAVAAHLALLFFGGLLFFHPKKETVEVTREAALFGDDTPSDKKTAEDKSEKEAVDEALAVQGEQVPDSSLIAKAQAPVNLGEARLDALSLSELESALNPNLAVMAEGGFVENLRLTSGGRIGGTAEPGTVSEDGPDTLFSIGDLDQKPRPLFQAPPIFPPDLRKKGIEGTVYIVFVVDPQGRVVNPQVEKSTHPGFEKPALDAIRHWRFEAGVKAGQKVAFKMRVPITFSKG